MSVNRTLGKKSHGIPYRPGAAFMTGKRHRNEICKLNSLKEKNAELGAHRSLIFNILMVIRLRKMYSIL
jgi:hypothetical protein